MSYNIPHTSQRWVLREDFEKSIVDDLHNNWDSTMLSNFHEPQYACEYFVD